MSKYQLNPDLKPGQLVQSSLPFIGNLVGVVDEVAPEVGRDGTQYMSHEYGVTVHVPGVGILWVFQEDTTILKEAK